MALVNSFLSMLKITVDEDLENSGAVRLLLDQAEEQISQLLDDAKQTLMLCRGEGGPAHYEAACAQDAAMLEDLLGAAKEGYTRLREMLGGVSFAAI